MIFSLKREPQKEPDKLEQETLQRWKRISDSGGREIDPLRTVPAPPEELYLEDEQIEFALPENTLNAVADRVTGGEGETQSAGVGRSNLAIPVEEDLKRRFGNNIKSALGPSTVIEGKFKFDTPVRIDGSLTGEVASSSVLIVGREASVQGRIEVGSLIVLGAVEGEVVAENLVEIRTGGELEGDITCKRVTIEDGGYYKGSCNMHREKEDFDPHL